MEKEKRTTMDLNKETAMKLWDKTFGKEIRVFDYAGREIAKGAYNDRNSNFGWNVDHIYPQSLGGKTAEHNLIVCHILTNDEKADKFPSFNANGKKFQIIKVENHYEIKPFSKQKNPEKKDEKPNFLDYSYGIKLFKSLKKVQKEPRFVASILVRFNNIYQTALIDFISQIFTDDNVAITSKTKKGYVNAMEDWHETRIIITNYNLATRADAQLLLDKCILLNTYLDGYFHDIDAFDEYEILYQIKQYSSKELMYKCLNNIMFNSVEQGDKFGHSLYINQMVLENTDAQDAVDDDYNERNGWILFNRVYSKLYENLERKAQE